MTFFERIQQRVWRFLYPVFPFLEHHLLFLHSKKRQQYHIGWLAKGQTLAGLKVHLSKEWGFGNHFVAWEDPDQVLSWRKLESFEEQYHLRVFNDGEIRGHYERTPEASPLDHLTETGMEPRVDMFYKYLGPFLTTTTYISKVEPDTSVPTPDAEVTFDGTKADA